MLAICVGVNAMVEDASVRFPFFTCGRKRVVVSVPKMSTRPECPWKRATPKRKDRGGRSTKWSRGESIHPSRGFNARKVVRELYTTSKGEIGFAKDLARIARKQKVSLRLLHMHAIHVAAEGDDLRLVEELLHNHIRRTDVDVVLNSTLGRNAYTPLVRAAYKGSDRMLRLLVASGADVHATNSHGEGLWDTLQNGETDAVNALPKEGIFIHSRFDDCRAFLRQRMMLRKERATTSMKVSRAPAWMPRHKRTVGAKIATWIATQYRRRWTRTQTRTQDGSCPQTTRTQDGSCPQTTRTQDGSCPQTRTQDGSCPQALIDIDGGSPGLSAPYRSVRMDISATSSSTARSAENRFCAQDRSNGVATQTGMCSGNRKETTVCTNVVPPAPPLPRANVVRPETPTPSHSF